jgi:hypothetical protein
VVASIDALPKVLGVVAVEPYALVADVTVVGAWRLVFEADWAYLGVVVAS